MQNRQLRIIGGQWRSRLIVFQEHLNLRPTPARVRETLFNWLQHDVPGSCCLDLFSGSGALGFEAASRGAEKVVQVENNALACRQLSATAINLNAKQIKLINADVSAFLSGNAEEFDLVFMDPPFTHHNAAQICHWLEDKNWLAPQAKIYVEVNSLSAMTGLPKNWLQLRNKTAGEVSYFLFARQPV